MTLKEILREIAKKERVDRDTFISFSRDKESAVSLFRELKRNGLVEAGPNLFVTESGEELPTYIHITKPGREYAAQ